MIEGETFLFPDGQDDHLWMIISDPALDPSSVVLVRFVTHREWLEQTCIVHPGEHPFVKHDTLVDFAAAKLVADSKLEALKAAGRLKPKQPLSLELLARIRSLVQCSDIPTKCLHAMQEQELSE